MSCACEGDRDGEIRAIVEFFKQTNTTWSDRWCRSRAHIEWAKGYRLTGFPPRLVLVQDQPGWQMMEFGEGFRCPTCIRLLRSVNGYSESGLTTAAKKQSEQG